jgi:hypothetical protein
MKTKTYLTSLLSSRSSRGVGVRSLRELCTDVRRQRGAIGWSLMYLVFGGGLIGAVVIYMLVKMIGG